MMINGGKFNTDTQALKRRIQSHDKYGSADLNQWIFDKLDLAAGLSVLDLGCGTGKQSIPMAQKVGEKGCVVSVDASRESLDTLHKTAKEAGVDRRIRVVCSGLDDLAGKFQDGEFSRVLGSYSLYYAKQTKKLVDVIHNALKKDGILFFCGPSNKNNAELKQFHYRLKNQPVPAEGGGADFMEDTGLKAARELFKVVDVFSFENPLLFDSADALYDYWSSYNLYDESLAGDFKKAAEKHFAGHPVFETVKRVVGVRGVA